MKAPWVIGPINSQSRLLDKLLGGLHEGRYLLRTCYVPVSDPVSMISVFFKYPSWEAAVGQEVWGLRAEVFRAKRMK
jgi:hypothetical protein